MNTPKPIRVAIVEDDEPTRDGIALLIGAAEAYQCVGVFGSVEDALRGLKRPPPDVLLLDIGLPGISGSDGVKLFRAQFPSMQVMMLTVYEGQEKIFESICNGACGYLLKKTPPARLLEAIREAHEGGSPISAEVARKVIALFRETQAAAGPSGERLTTQEVRMLSLLAEGYSYLNAAGQLDITVNTVRNYIRSIYEKLQVHTKSEAVSKALRSGLIR